MSNTSQKIVTREERSIEYVPFGGQDSIKLNVAIIQKLVAVPTKRGNIPSPDDCIKFMMLCQAKHLNPFEGDCYMLGYDTQDGPKFSQITAHQVYLKRAEASEKFDGILSGVIIRNPSKEMEEREGDFVADDETLLGGWAKVFKKGVQHPVYRRLKLSVFNTGQSRWAKDPAGMIVKCVEADALRTSFPTMLGGLYMKEERPEIEIASRAPQIAAPVFRPTLTEATSDGVNTNTGFRGAEEQQQEQPKRTRKPREPKPSEQTEPTPKEEHHAEPPKEEQQQEPVGLSDPLEEVKRLIATVPRLEAGHLVSWMVRNRMAEPAQNMLGKLSVSQLNTLIDRWVFVVEDLGGQA